VSIELSHDSYGKSRVRLVKVTRHGDRHDLRDVMVAVRFEGDFKASYVDGANDLVLPTDTMKNTVYALARDHPLDQIEDFGLALSAHFISRNPQVSRVRIEIEERPWGRIVVGGRASGHAFTAGGDERRTAMVTSNGARVSVVAGVQNLVVLKTRGSAFEGFLTDRYTTLKETSDRILATALSARWTYARPEVTFGPYWKGVRQALLDTFAEHTSQSVQHTLYAMGRVVLDAHPDISEITLEMPNRHHLPVDLSPFGLDNPNEIFVPTEEPHGMIAATLTRS
jgi:urate oxidase